MAPTYRRVRHARPRGTAGGGGAPPTSLGAVRIRLFLAMSLAIAVVAGLTVLAYDTLDVGGDGGDQVVSAPEGGSTVTTGDVRRADEVRVTGAVTTVLIDGAVLQPREVPTPLVVTSEQGFGNGGDLTTVQVAGEDSTIVWDGGRPFSLTSGGALVLDPVDLALVPGGLKLVLGGGNHAFSPGTYQLDTPVAVGPAGLATARDAVRFDAEQGSLFEARGDASLLFAPDAPRRFIGPGRVILGGALEVTEGDDTRAETGLMTADVAAFDLTFTPDGAGGWTVDGLVDDATFPLPAP